MSLSLRPYPDYKDSGMPHLGEIPTHWRVQRAKHVFRAIDIRSELGDEELLTVSSSDGVVPRSEKKVTMFKAESYVGYKLCWPGDLVINSLWAWMRGLGFARHHGIVSSAYGVYRPKPEFTSASAFLNYLLRSTGYDWELHVRSKGIWISRLQLTDESFFDMPIVLPPSEEARSVAAFLDFQEGRIRKLVHAKRREIALVEQEKGLIIQQLMSSSAVDNSACENTLVPLRWFVRVSSGDFLDAEKMSEMRDAQHPFPVVGGNGVMAYADQFNTSGDTLVVGRVGALCGNVHFIEEKAWVTDNALIVSNVKGYDLEYLSLCLRLLDLNRLANANAQPLVTGGVIKSQKVAKPPLEQQHKVVRQVKEATARCDAKRRCLQAEIDLVREYRTRLITDVVTGKLDVRGVLVPAIEEVDELQPLVDKPAESVEAEEGDDLVAAEEGEDAAN